jgi:hypothetical protein
VPFDLDGLLDRWSSHRAGRPITLIPLTAEELPPGTCALWLALAGQDIIGYPVGVPQNHRDHIVLHELGHMLAAHIDGLPGGESVLAGLMPDLDPAMVRSVLGRSVYSSVQEQEAELIASLIMQRTLGTSPEAGYTGAAGAVMKRLEWALDR